MWFFWYTDFNLGYTKIFDGFYGKEFFLQVGFSNYPLIFQNHTLFILGFWNALFWKDIQTTDKKFSARTYHNPNHAKKKKDRSSYVLSNVTRWTYSSMLCVPIPVTTILYPGFKIVLWNLHSQNDCNSSFLFSSQAILGMRITVFLPFQVAYSIKIQYLTILSLRETHKKQSKRNSE